MARIYVEGFLKDVFSTHSFRRWLLVDRRGSDNNSSCAAKISLDKILKV
jgi:hypothetical protein